MSGHGFDIVNMAGAGVGAGWALYEHDWLAVVGFFGWLVAVLVALEHRRPRRRADD